MNIKQLITLLTTSIMLLLAVNMAMAATNTPESPDTLTPGDSGRYNGQVNALTVEAEAGNVTALVLTDVRSTRFWQGYYGNITGEITLDDASNNTLFSWSLATPQGEIYAVNTSAAVNWYNITCVNLTGNATDPAVKINMSNLHNAYGINDSAKDNFNWTFNTTFSGEFLVGPSRIVSTNQNCAQTYTYINQAWQQTDYKEVLLFDNVSALIFATILENSIDGFRAGGNDLHDFQMLVAENGNSGGPDLTTTTYYFYVELE